MKNFRKAISLFLVVAVVCSFSVTAFAAHTIKDTTTGVYYSDDFEEYTDGTAQDNDTGVVALHNNGYITSSYTKNIKDVNGTTVYRSSIYTADGNKYLRLLKGNAKFKNGDDKDISNFFDTYGFNSFKIEFDTMFETDLTGDIDFQYRAKSGKRFYLYFETTGKVKYGTGNSSEPSEWTYIKNDNGTDFTITPGEWYKFEAIYENESLTFKYDNKVLRNTVLNEDEKTLYRAQFTNDGLFSEHYDASSGKYTALCIDNVNIQGYNYYPSVLFEETFNYDVTYGDGTAHTTINSANSGQVTVGTGQPEDGKNYLNDNSYKSEIVTDGNNKYLRTLVESRIYSKDTETLLTTYGYDSFMLEYDAKYEGSSENEIHMRYRKNDSKEEGYIKCIFWINDEKVLYTSGGNTDVGSADEVCTINQNEFKHFTYMYSNGTLKMYCDNIFVDEIPFASLSDAMFGQVYCESDGSKGALSLDNIKITGFKSSEAITYSVKTGDEELTASNLTNNAPIVFTASGDFRALASLNMYLAIFNKDTKELVAVVSGTNASPTVMTSEATKSAAYTIPETGKYIVKPFVWSYGLKPLNTIEPVTMP